MGNYGGCDTCGSRRNCDCAFRAQLAEAREQVRTLTEERDTLAKRMSDVDDVLVVNWVGPPADNDYRRALARLMEQNILEHNDPAISQEAASRATTLSRLREALESAACSFSLVESSTATIGTDYGIPKLAALARAEEAKLRAALSLLDPVASEPKPENGADLIAAERQRQTSVEGWTQEHDAQHGSFEISRAALCYAEAAVYPNLFIGVPDAPLAWPWEGTWWKPSEDPIRNLVKAGALIAAEIDRLQSLSIKIQPTP